MDKRITLKIVVTARDTSKITYSSITSFIKEKFVIKDISKANIFILENYNKKATYLIMGYGITKEYICNTAIEFLEDYLRGEAL